MKRQIMSILLISVLVSGVLVACGQKSEPIPYTPLRTEKEMTYALYDYFFDKFSFNIYWARPFLPLNDKWSASYNGAGNWVVKAYDIDRSYAGAWLVPETAYYGKDYDKVSPYDDEAKRITSGVRRIAKMPPRPPFLSLSNSPREDMIQVVQVYIANMSRSEAEDAFITDIWQAVRNRYPLEWHVVYNDSLWWLVADYYEYRVRVYITPSTGQIKVEGDFSPSGWGSLFFD